MKSLPVYRTSLLLLLSLAVPAALHAQSDCSQIFEHGIFNAAPSSSLELKTRTFVNWLSQSSFDSYATALDSARQLGFSLDAIPAQIGSHQRASDWRNYQASMQTLDMSDKRNLARFTQVVDAAGRAMAKASQTCLSNTKGAAHAVIELTYDPFKFKVRLTYDATDAPASISIRDFTITPDSATCTPTPLHDTTLESSGLRFNCTRQSYSDPIQISANTDKGPLLAKIPGLTPPSPMATKVLDTPLPPTAAGCPAAGQANPNIDKTKQDGNQPVYVCP